MSTRALGRTCLLVLATALLGARAQADELRNVKVGEAVPEFSVRTLSGETLASDDLRDRVVVIVYVSAEQRSSGQAMRAADIVAQEFRDRDLTVAFMTADVTRTEYFRAERDRLGIHLPFGLDAGRSVYGGLGLIVVPTTIVIDETGRLRRVIASYKSDYEHVLRTYVRHALGLIDDEKLAAELSTERFERDLPENRIARHRAAARLLRRNGLLPDAGHELEAALEIDPGHAETILDLAVICLDTDDVPRAHALVERVTAGGDVPRRTTLVRGIVLFREGDLDGAEVALRESLLMNPDPARTHYYLGLIAEQRGDESGAIRHLKASAERLLREHD